MRFLNFAIFALLFSCACALAHGQTPTNFRCTGAGSAAGLSWDCPGSGTVNPPPVVVTPPAPPQAGGCTQGAPSDSLGGVILARACTGTATYSGGRFGLPTYSGPMSDLGTVIPANVKGAVATWPNYLTGFSFTPILQAGTYISLGFKPTSSGSIQFTNDPSFGVGGLISLSTVPGAFNPTTPGVVCSYGRGASNSLYINTTPGAYCSVAANTQYYVNFAGYEYTGIKACYDGSTACQSTPISYSAAVGK